MIIIAFLIGCSFIMAVGFLIAFFWAVKDGQNDDMYTPSIRILFEDKLEIENTKNKTQKTTTKD